MAKTKSCKVPRPYSSAKTQNNLQSAQGGSYRKDRYSSTSPRALLTPPPAVLVEILPFNRRQAEVSVGYQAPMETMSTCLLKTNNLVAASLRVVTTSF